MSFYFLNYSLEIEESIKINVTKDSLPGYSEDNFNPTVLYQYSKHAESRQGKEKGCQDGLLKVNKITALRLKDILMSFLLHLNEDLDDDLLFDSIGMIVDL